MVSAQRQNADAKRRRSLFYEQKGCIFSECLYHPTVEHFPLVATDRRLELSNPNQKPNQQQNQQGNQKPGQQQGGSRQSQQDRQSGKPGRDRQGGH